MPELIPNNPTDPVALLLARLAELSAPIMPEALTPEQAATLCGVSRSKWHEMNAAGMVPAPVELGDRCPRWLRSELLAWLRAGAPSRTRWAGMKDQVMRKAG